MPSIRAEIWCAAFVRRHNDRGQICVVARKGDAIAGQVWIEVDHLDGTSSLFSKAPSLLDTSENLDWLFQIRFLRKDQEIIKARLVQESNFDPDFWLLVLEDPKGDHGLNLVKPNDQAPFVSAKT